MKTSNEFNTGILIVMTIAAMTGLISVVALDKALDCGQNINSNLLNTGFAFGSIALLLFFFVARYYGLCVGKKRGLGNANGIDSLDKNEIIEIVSFHGPYKFNKGNYYSFLFKRGKDKYQFFRVAFEDIIVKKEVLLKTKFLKYQNGILLEWKSK